LRRERREDCRCSVAGRLLHTANASHTTPDRHSTRSTQVPRTFHPCATRPRLCAEASEGATARAGGARWRRCGRGAKGARGARGAPIRRALLAGGQAGKGCLTMCYTGRQSLERARAAGVRRTKRPAEHVPGLSRDGLVFSLRRENATLSHVPVRPGLPPTGGRGPRGVLSRRARPASWRGWRAG